MRNKTQIISEMTSGRGKAGAPRACTTSRRWGRRFLAAALGAAIIAGAGSGIANAKEDKELSLYAVASSVTAYFASALKPGSETDPPTGNWKTVMGEPGTAGAVLGYADDDLNPVQWLVSQLTASSQAIEYSSLDQEGREGVRAYAEYGATLNALGLDSTSTGMSSNMMSFIGGFIIFVAWGLAEAVSGLFSGVLMILQWFNPFQLLFKGVSELDASKGAGMVNDNAHSGWLSTALSGLTTYIGDIYTTVSALSWAVLVPMFVAVTFIFIMLGKAKGGMLKKLIVRLIFIVAGIPLLGSMYTSTLDSMREANSGADSGAIQVVISTFVDFEAWSTNERLALPENTTVEWDRKTNQPTTESFVAVQDTARAINALSHSELAGMAPLFTMGSNKDWADLNGTYDPNAVAVNNDNAAAIVQSLLTRYMSGAKVEAASFASDVQGGATGNDNAPGWFEALRGDDIEDVPSNALVRVAPNSALIATVDDDTDVVTFSTPTVSLTSASCGARLTDSTGTGGALLPCSMSALTLYNYLNTSFDSKSMTVYSSNKVASGAVREVHNSVTLAGTGFSSLIYWLNAFVLLGSFAILGIGYAIALLMGNISAGFKVLTATPFAMLGALGAITKVLVYVITMVLEIIVTIFLFKIVQEMLLAIPKVFSHVGALLLRSDSATGKMSGAYVIVPLIGSVIIVAFTIMALRLRKSVVKAISEVATKIIESVVGGEAGPTGTPGGAMGKLAGGAVNGAGMAMGAKAMGGGGSGSPVAGSSGPASVSASGAAGSMPGAESNVGQGMGVAGEPGASGGAGGGGGSRASEAADQALGLQVAQKGLTASPGNSNSGTDSTLRVQNSGSSGSGQNPASTGTGADVLDSVYDSGSRDNEARAGISKQKREAAMSGVVAVGTAARAVGRAYAGDEVGAVSDGMAAAGKVSGGAQKAQEAKRAERALDSAPAPASSGSRGGGSSAPRQASRPASAVIGSGAPQPAPKSPTGGGGTTPPKRVLPVSTEQG